MTQPQRPLLIQSNGLGTAGFVVSLIGLFFTCGLLCPVGMVFSFIALMKPPRGLAFAGFILGILGSWWLFAFGLALLAGLSGIPASERSLNETDETIIATDSTMPEMETEIPERPQLESSRFRKWSSSDGKFSADAEFIWSNGTAARLRKSDGSEITVPLDRLSDSDKQWIIARKRQ